MNARREAWLSLIQRLTALVLAPLVLVHLLVILYAVGDGLSAAEILARTQGSLLWAGFYGLFVLAAAVHGALGLRVIALEMTGWRGGSLDLAALAFVLLLLALGWRAVGAVT